MPRYLLPEARPGQVIGLLGGSFDPAHEGHRHLTLEAMKRFRLDRVWWLVSPGNPLKPVQPAPIERRLEQARKVMDHPRVIVTDLERYLHTRYTSETLKKMIALYPGVHFVWLMGADNLAGFHRWENWEWIMQNVRVGVIARPGHLLEARMSPAAARFRFARLGQG
ncbi:MAG: nicotinate-nucleotide adenylyltransferase, partial [Deltaproteobacteria bacterium]